MHVVLKHKGWLRRVLTVTTPEASYTVEYSGRGLGYETVSVDHEVVAGGTSVRWFIPRFEFALGARPAVVEVRVWPWFAVRSLSLFVGGTLLYQE
jgi:hypothetical protein